jgi:hypothetical protein
VQASEKSVIRNAQTGNGADAEVLEEVGNRVEILRYHWLYMGE